MANVKVTLDYPINDGMSLTFKAPCDCTAVTGLIVYYPSLTEDASTTTSKVFTFKDSHGNNLSDVGNLFTTGAYVKVILDTTNNAAYIQNADTNGYLENKISSLENKSDVFSAEYGVTTVAEIEVAYNAGKVIVCKDTSGATGYLYMRVSENMFIFMISNSTAYMVMDDNWITQTMTHASTHASDGTDPITPASIGAAPAYTYGTTDLTAGTSNLTTGTLYFVYE